MAKVVEEEGTELVILGKQSIDGDYGQTAQMLAAQLDWAQGTSLYSVSCPKYIRIIGTKVLIESQNPPSIFLLLYYQLKHDGGSATVEREIDGGLETVELSVTIC